jgi:hypothetical protein
MESKVRRSPSFPDSVVAVHGTIGGVAIAESTPNFRGTTDGELCTTDFPVRRRGLPLGRRYGFWTAAPAGAAFPRRRSLAVDGSGRIPRGRGGVDRRGRKSESSGNAAVTLRFLDCGALGRRFPALPTARGGQLGAGVHR